MPSSANLLTEMIIFEADWCRFRKVCYLLTLHMQSLNVTVAFDEPCEMQAYAETLGCILLIILYECV